MKSYELSTSKIGVYLMLFIGFVHVVVLTVTIVTIGIDSPKFLIIVLPISILWFLGLGLILKQALRSPVQIEILSSGLLRLRTFQGRQREFNVSDIQAVRASYASWPASCSLTIQHANGTERFFVEFSTLRELFQELQAINPSIHLKVGRFLKLFHRRQLLEER